MIVGRLVSLWPLQLPPEIRADSRARPLVDDFRGKVVMFVALGVGRSVHVWLPVLVSIGYGVDIIRVIMSEARTAGQQVDETTAVPVSHNLFLDNGARGIYFTSK
jgi:hypothetical protein